MPYDENELEKIGIFPFEWIADRFDEADLLIGNGFSISLCERLSYKSLFNDFLATRENETKKIFESFETTNFELIIQVLNNAEAVNKILQIPIEPIEPVRQNLREGLIGTIQKNHPSHAEIFYPQLISLADELFEFYDIYTTNYDVFLYKTILQKISKYREKRIEDPYEDYFYDELSGLQLGFAPEKVFRNSRTIYYLHGALFIYQTPNKTATYKLRRLEHVRFEYIQLIRREIENNNLPIFVAEGDHRDKLRTITNNSYLNFCARQLQSMKRNLVVYGFSFGKSDSHIVDYINKSDTESIAISIYVGNKTIKQLDEERSSFTNLFTKKEVVVYNSDSLFPSLRPF